MNCTAPDQDCRLCPRLAGFRHENRTKFPDKFNAPVPSFGDDSARLLIVGLAPGLQGANFTGRPFTGDWAGDLLYATLLKFAFADGVYGEHKDDGLRLIDCRITNAVRCVPPENKPTGDEIRNCQIFLKSELAAMKRLAVVLALGTIAHDAVVRATGHKRAAFKFTHGGTHEIGSGRRLIGSYHCSRYNTNTGRLTPAMFEDIFSRIRDMLP